MNEVRMGKFKKRINELKEAHEKIAKGFPNAFNSLLRSKVIESLGEVEEWFNEAKAEFPPLKAIARALKLVDDFKGNPFAIAFVRGLLWDLWLTEEKWFGEK